MFCPKCGAENGDNNDYCVKCGTLLNGSIGKDNSNSNDEKNIIIKELEYVIPFLQQLDSLEERTEELINQAAPIKIQMDEHLTKINNNDQSGRNVGAIISPIVIILFFLQIGFYGLIVGVPLGVVVGLLIKFVPASKTYDKNRYATLKIQYDDLSEEIEKNKNTIESIIEKIRDRISVLPETYRYYIAANYIYNTLNDGRADNMKEALNLYEEQLHRWKIENANDTMTALQRQQASDVNKIKIINAANLAVSILKK